MSSNTPISTNTTEVQTLTVSQTGGGGGVKTTNSISSGKNDLIIKLIFPPTSSMISKFMFVQENQKVCDVVDYATQLAGLQSGYSLYLPASTSTGRGQWLDDDSLLTNYSISNSGQILIKKKPGLMKRRNTMMTLKSFKEGKVQKLSSITKIWSPRYLRLYSQRLVHSSSENDSNTDFIQFSDITNVDKEINRKYTFVIYCSNTSTTTTGTGTTNNNSSNLSQSQTTANFQNSYGDSRKEKEYIFRCINQSEMEDWVNSIRLMLRKARPDLLLAPLAQPIIVNNQNNNNNSNNIVSSLSPTTSSSSSTTTTLSPPSTSNTTWTVPNSPKNNISLNKSVNNNSNSNSSSTEVSPAPTPTKTRSFSFSLTRPGSGGSKKKDLPPYNPTNSIDGGNTTPPLQPTLSERNVQLEEEIKKLTEAYNRDVKSKAELERKYQKIKVKMAALKKQARSRSLSTPATPEPSRKDSKSSTSFISNFIIGSSRSKDKDQSSSSSSSNQQPQQQQQQLSASSSSIPQQQQQNISHHKRHSSTSQSMSFNNNNNNNNNYSSYSNKGLGVGDDDNTDNDITSSEMFTGSIYDGEDADDFEKDKEIKELKDQLLKIKEKLQLDLVEKKQNENNFKNLEKELYTQKKLDEKREREILANEQRQIDYLDSMSELASRLKKSLFELKDKLEKEEKDHQKEIDDHDHDYQQEEEEEEEEVQEYERKEQQNHSNNHGDDDDDGQYIDQDEDDIYLEDEEDDYEDDENHIINNNNSTTASIKEDIDYNNQSNI